jgi:23S rRNA (cytidine2498-2'-O)-methyltransferase
MRKPERIQPPAVPVEPSVPITGRWVWICRAQFEPYLFEELARLKAKPRALGLGAVESEQKAEGLVFARAGFRVVDAVGAKGRVEAWTLDTPVANACSAAVRAQADAVVLEAADTPRWVLCAFSRELTVKGADPVGGPKRMKREADALSRASLKVDEALEWLGDAPGRGETCVDLGAAPGGWTQRLLARGAKVIAVDPAKLKVPPSSRLKHVQDSAFRFQPQEPVEWLFCDMAWRPLEVAQLLAKWGRHRWAIRVVANIKLPMQEKWPMLDRVRETLSQGGWRDVKMRQLYHDRDEVTLTARSF